MDRFAFGGEKFSALSTINYTLNDLILGDLGILGEEKLTSFDEFSFEIFNIIEIRTSSSCLNY